MMTSEERYIRCMNYETTDHVTDMEFGYWTEIPSLWEKEGLPKGLDTNEKMELYFGLERRYFPLPVNVLLEPDFPKREEIEIRDGFCYYFDDDRVICRVPVGGKTTMPEHLEYPLKSRTDWENIFKPRFNPDTPGRVHENLPAFMDNILEKNYMPWLYVGSLFGRLRNFVGFQEICYMIYDDPLLVDEIIGHMAALTCDILEKSLPQVKGKISHAHFWEDICFNTGPMISPAFFREHLLPRYKEITSVLKGNGINLISLDCDGWIGPLVDGWIEAGINTMFPLERASGSDPVMLRKKYGPGLRLMGGVDKRKISAGGDAIIRELECLAPLVEEGGFIPHCDHLCPADVTLERYRFYLRKKREIFGIPQKEERIRNFPCEK